MKNPKNIILAELNGQQDELTLRVKLDSSNPIILTKEKNGKREETGRLLIAQVGGWGGEELEVALVTADGKQLPLSLKLTVTIPDPDKIKSLNGKALELKKKTLALGARG